MHTVVEFKASKGMKSHVYAFSSREIAAFAVTPLPFLVLFALLMHLGAAREWLPAPLPTVDTDRTILYHQAQASLQPHAAELVLIGDSSCLMDVAAPDLGRSLNTSVLNLGTLSYLDLSAYASILEHYLAANPKPPRTVVLLMHPEALRRTSPTEFHTDALASFYARKDLCPPTLPAVLCLLGVETFRGRLLSRAVPQPLGGSFGRQYGFTHNLWKYLSDNRGSAVDPGDFDSATATGNAEYRLAPSLERTSRQFRQTLPPGIKLVVGLTPVPQSFAPALYAQTRLALLRGWNDWLQADRILEELPATLPDDLFASTTHLNATGVAAFTSELARQFQRGGASDLAALSSLDGL
jgi:hypothetical protein